MGILLAVVCIGGIGLLYFFLFCLAKIAGEADERMGMK